MVNDNNGAMANSDGHPGMMPGGAADIGDGVYSRRVQLLTFLVAGVACWIPIVALVYLFL